MYPWCDAFAQLPGYMQMQKPGAQIMCAVRSSAIVLPKDWEKLPGKHGQVASVFNIILTQCG